MIEFTQCPYCYNNVRVDLGIVTTIDIDVYKEYKCNHCAKVFIYKLRIELPTYKNPTDK